MKGDEHDVIVVGASAAGAATALLLARGGLRTLVTRRHQPGSATASDPRVDAGRGVAVSRWGLLEGIVAAGTPAVKRTTLRYGDEVVVITSSRPTAWTPCTRRAGRGARATAAARR